MGGDTPRDRGQAYVLEGVLGALLVVIAILFAVQTSVLTPTTGGGVTPETRSQLQTTADDLLVVSATNGTPGLAAQVRRWDPGNRSFAGARGPRSGYTADGPPGDFGTLLANTFSETGRRYNVAVRYRAAEGPDAGTVYMVYQGDPPESAVAATHTVTLLDNMTLTGSAATSTELWEYDANATDNDDGYYPIPDAVDGPVYNVVTVRVVVW
jgi:hypothetical protein